MSDEEKMSGKMNALPNADMNEQNTVDPIEIPKTDLDSAWKDVIDGLFEPFTEFFFPKIHRDIDFSKGIETLDPKSTGISPYGNVGKRYADELVKVHLKDGSQVCVCVFIHIEVQGSREKEGIFPERTYIYNYRAFDKNIDKGVKVISVAILTDEDENYRPNEYRVRLWDFELRMKIPIVKIIDFKNKKKLRKKLETSANPMAMVVKSQLKRYELKKTGAEKKSTVKWDLIRQCYERGYTKKEILVLLKFIDWLILLPEGLDKQLSKKIAKLEEDYKMPYVTSWERIAKDEGVKIGEKRGVKIGKDEGVKIGEKRGVKIGKDEGVKIGEKRGKLDAAREFLRNGVDINIVVKSTGHSRKEIEKLAKELVQWQ